MSDGQINDQSCEVRRIRSPGGQWRSWLLELYVRSPPSQSEEKTQQQNFCRLRRQTALWYTLDEEKRTEREVRNCPLKRVRSRQWSNEFHSPSLLVGFCYRAMLARLFRKHCHDGCAHFAATCTGTSIPYAVASQSVCDAR